MQIEVVEDSLFANAASGNVTAQIFFLCNRTRHLPAGDKRKWVHVNRTELAVARDDDFNALAERLIGDPELAADVERRLLGESEEASEAPAG